jgi:hypothetical protein
MFGVAVRLCGPLFNSYVAYGLKVTSLLGVVAKFVPHTQVTNLWICEDGAEIIFPSSTPLFY